ncbi:hypothetical protein U9M48_019386, partial [Paspalum notatum var. saurae]
MDPRRRGQGPPSSASPPCAARVLDPETTRTRVRAEPSAAPPFPRFRAELDSISPPPPYKRGHETRHPAAQALELPAAVEFRHWNQRPLATPFHCFLDIEATPQRLPGEHLPRHPPRFAASPLRSPPDATKATVSFPLARSFLSAVSRPPPCPAALGAQRFDEVPLRRSDLPPWPQDLDPASPIHRRPVKRRSIPVNRHRPSAFCKRDPLSLKYIFTQPKLNMRERRWLELIKDYDLEVHYHPGKANVVANALRRKTHCNFIEARPTVRVLCCEIGDIEMPTVVEAELYNLVLEPTIKDQIIVAQKQDKGMSHIRDEINDKKKAYFKLDEEGVLWFKNHLVVPKDMELRKKILDEAHTSMFTLHPGSNKMYQDLKQKFWWTRMKREIAKYVSECDVCQRVKADHLKPTGMLQPLAIPAWKWEDIHMDFIVGLPCTQKGYDSIWVIIDRFTKSAHLIPVKIIYRAKQYAELYNSGLGSLFVSRFWEQLQIALGTNLIHNSAYHPQTSGQVERVNQILEDMLRACTLTCSTKWDECLPLAEFAYNNSYQKSLDMAPFEALYGERVTFGPDLVTQAEEQVKFIHGNLKRAQSRQKSYSDKRRRPLVFEKEDHVYLRVSPMKGVHRFGVKGNKDQHEEELLTSTRCSGVITPKKRQLGNKRNFCKPNTP